MNGELIMLRDEDGRITPDWVVA